MRPKRNRNTHQIKGKEPIVDAMAECVFPEEIMLCILTRLPVKSLLRFKSVCKPWCELFATPNFIKMHLHQFSSDPKNDAFIIQSFSGFTDSTISLFSIELNAMKPTNLRCRGSNSLKLRVACCNGLVCIGFLPIERGIVALWNPALRLSKFVRIERDFGKYDQISLGLGYDAEGDDFKVVMITYTPGTEVAKKVCVEVYSAKSDSWEKIKLGFKFRVVSLGPIATINGNPYWWALYVDENNEPGEAILVWCDVTKLEMKMASLSDLTLEGVSPRVPYVDWKGSLAALVCTKNEERLESIDVWVYDDGEMTWRKNHSFGPIEMKVDGCLQRSKNGIIMGKCSNGKLFVFDPENGWVKEIEHENQQPCHMIYGYNESLAYIEGMEQVVVKREVEEEEDDDDPFAGPTAAWL